MLFMNRTSCGLMYNPIIPIMENISYLIDENNNTLIIYFSPGENKMSSEMFLMFDATFQFLSIRRWCLFSQSLYLDFKATCQWNAAEEAVCRFQAQDSRDFVCFCFFSCPFAIVMRTYLLEDEKHVEYNQVSTLTPLNTVPYQKTSIKDKNS